MAHEFVFGVIPKEEDAVQCTGVFSSRIARRLLRRGHVIRDIKPNREDLRKTVFYFEVTEKFKTDFQEILAEVTLEDTCRN